MTGFFRRVSAALLTAVMTVCLTGPCPLVLADKKKFKPESASFSSYELVTYEGDLDATTVAEAVASVGFQLA